MARPHIEPYVALNDPFRKFDINGFKGSHYKVLSLDTDTGACTLKVRFDGGYKRKPGLTYSDIEIFVLNGQIKVGKETWREGHYAYIPAGYAIEALSVPQGAEALVMFSDSEPHFEESRDSHDLALREGFTSVNTYAICPKRPPRESTANGPAATPVNGRSLKPCAKPNAPGDHLQRPLRKKRANPPPRRGPRCPHLHPSRRAPELVQGLPH